MKAIISSSVVILLIVADWHYLPVSAFVVPQGKDFILPLSGEESKFPSIVALGRSSKATSVLRAVAKLDDWRVAKGGGVTGTVTNHPDRNVEDGDVLTTSTISDDFDLELINEGAVVFTASGSRYRLGTRRPQNNIFFKLMGKNKGLSNGKQKSKPNPKVKSNQKVKSNKKVKSNQKVKPSAKDLQLSQRTIGGGKYILGKKPRRSTSGKSQIYIGYKCDKSGEPSGKALTIKISTNIEALTRENKNYNRICSGLFPGRFVSKVAFLPELDSDPPQRGGTQSGALIIEAGERDLKAVLAERGGIGLSGRALRDAAVAAVQCAQAAHSSGIVWTDLKSENFVVVSEEIGNDGGLPGVKGIDLESGIPNKGNPVDFSPEACPPEFARAFQEGTALDFKLDYSYDIWSLGMLFYELAVGTPYFDGKASSITKALGDDDGFQAEVGDEVEDKNLRELIRQCLRSDPRKRPGVTQILLHPYFFTSGFGSFGF